MNRTDSLQAARDFADDLDIDDEQFVDETLVEDELFAAYAYIYEQAEIYATELDKTMATDAMKSAAWCAVEDAQTVAVIRAEELLGDSLEQPHSVYKGP